MIGSRTNSIPAPVRLAIFLWGGLYAALDPFRAFDNADLYWQGWLGEYILHWHRLPSTLGTETFTATGAPWVPQEWFFSILVALAMRHHLLVPFAIAIAIVPIAVFGSIYIRSRGRAGPEAIGIVLLLVGCALSASFGIRAQVLGYGCFAAFLLCLGRSDRWAYVAVPVVAVWANVHASVLLAPVFLLARMTGAVADSGLRTLQKGRDIRIFALTLAAVCCTPLGWHLPVYALALVTSPIRHFIQEWQPVSFGDLDFLFGGLSLALLLVAGGWRELVRNKQESLPIAMLFIAMLFASRNVPIFAIAAAPAAASGLSALFLRSRASATESRRWSVSLFLRQGLSSFPLPCSLLGFGRATRRRFLSRRWPSLALTTVSAGYSAKILATAAPHCSIPGFASS